MVNSPAKHIGAVYGTFLTGACAVRGLFSSCCVPLVCAHYIHWQERYESPESQQDAVALSDSQRATMCFVVSYASAGSSASLAAGQVQAAVKYPRHMSRSARLGQSEIGEL